MYVKTLMNQISTMYYRKNDVEEAAFVAIPDSNSIYRERYPLDYSNDHAEERTMGR